MKIELRIHVVNAFLFMFCLSAPPTCHITQSFQGSADVTVECWVSILTPSTNLTWLPTNETIDLTITCISTSQISKLSANYFAVFPHLRKLKLNQCIFTTLPPNCFELLNELRVLELTGFDKEKNELHLPTSFSRDLANLVSLKIAKNGLTELPNSLLCRLETLDKLVLFSNSIQQVEAVGCISSTCCTKLAWLSLENNSITVLNENSFRGLESLRLLLLNSNNIVQVHENTFSLLLQLEKLDISQNKLIRLPPKMLASNRLLHSFLADVNNINEIPSNFFENLELLEKLSICNNRLSSVGNADSFKNLRALRYLHLERNYLTDSVLSKELFSPLQNLTELNLSNNKLSLRETNIFSSLRLLQKLYLSNNVFPVLDIALNNLKFLKLLAITDSNIEQITLATFFDTSINSVILSANVLQRLLVNNEAGEKVALFTDVQGLETLDLSNNFIIIFDYYMIPTSLKTLRLRNNRIMSLADSRHIVEEHKITTIDIEDNHFLDIEMDSFPPTIERIQCTDCTIRQISTATFAHTERFFSINLTNSGVQKIERFAFGYFNNSNNVSMRLPTVLITADSYCAQTNKLPKYYIGYANMLSKYRGSLQNFKTVVNDFQFLKIPNPLNPDVLFICTMLSECQSVFTGLIYGPTFTTLDCGNQDMTIIPTCTQNEIHQIYFDGNNCTTLRTNAFETFVALTALFLNNSKIGEIEKDAFLNLRQLQELHLEDNKLSNLDYSLFQNLKSLRKLYLNNNCLSTFIIVGHLRNLLELHLENTCIRELNETQFGNAKQLTKLFLSNNRIQYLAIDTFRPLTFITEIHLDYNNLSGMFSFPYFSYLVYLEVIFLNGNQITTLAGHIFNRNTYLTQLHLENNRIKNIDVNTFHGLKFLKHLWLSNNEISFVDCSIFNKLLRILSIHLEFNRLSHFNCRNFEWIRTLKHLHLQNNSLSYFNASELAPLTTLKHIDIQNNLLRSLNVWDLPKSLTKLNISGNPFTCDCDFLIPLHAWITNEGLNKIKDIQHVYCYGANGHKADLTIMSFTESYCLKPSSIIVPLVSSVGSIFVLLVTVVLLYWYRYEMQVILYSRYGFRFFYTSGEADIGKTYHAFVAYSSEDEDFVARELVSELEPRYRLCIGTRDFAAGAYITDTICLAVEKSCRTLLILSPNFVKSEWCRYEFKTAHYQTLTDRCCRLVVIILEDVDSSEIEKELKIYLHTNTYLRWGDRFFWEKLRYILPDVDEQAALEERQPLLLNA